MKSIFYLVLLPYASLEALKALLQRLIACLNINLDSEYLFYLYELIYDFYELWQ